MKTRTKWFLGMLAASFLVASVVARDPKIAATGALLAGATWLAWRGYVFLSILLRPVRDSLKPVEDHLDASMRRAGMGAFIDAATKVQDKIDAAVDVAAGRSK